MRKIDLRGGALEEYNISEILGQRFKMFVHTLRNANGSLTPFTFGALSKISGSTNGAKPNDLHYDFTDYLVGASAAFREIEKPDLEKAEISKQYSSSIYQIYDELVNGNTTGSSDVPVHKFGFKQLPYRKYNSVEELVPGFHLLGYSNNIYRIFDDNYDNDLVNAIRYLQHYVALLDTENLKAKDVITLLRGDNLVFMKYVDGITDLLSNPSYYGNSPQFPKDAYDSLHEGVLSALTAVAQQLITEYQQMRIQRPPTINYDLSDVDLRDNTEVKNYLKRIGIQNQDQVYNALSKVDKTYAPGDNAENIVGDLNRLKQYNVDSLLNPIYMDTNNVTAEIEASYLDNFSSQLRGGRNRTFAEGRDKAHDNALRNNNLRGGQNGLRRRGMETTNGKVFSLPFLYGPLIAGKSKLANQEQNGNGTELVKDDAIKNIKDVVDVLENSGSTNNNYGRAIVLGILHYMISNGQGWNNIDKDSLNSVLGNIVDKAAVLLARLRNIDHNKDNLAKYRDAFATEFVLGSYEGFKVDDDTRSLRRREGERSRPEKTNLSIEPIRSFYKNVVSQDPDFYKQFFNLVNVENKKPAELGIEPIPDSNLGKYRLNVKKLQGYTRLIEAQLGGANGFGDIVFVGLIPDYPTDGSIGDIWVSPRERISRDRISTNSDAVRSIARNAYLLPSDTNVFDIYDTRINISEAIRRVRSGIYSSPEYGKNWYNLLRGLVTDMGPTVSGTWQESEMRLSEHLLRHNNRWVRNGENNDLFVLKNEKGEIIAESPENNCTLLGTDTATCIDFLTSCLSKGANVEDCEQLLDFDFTINPAMNQLAEQVKMINPAVAFGILKQFKFGSYLSKETSGQFSGLHVYKVQSVSSWLQELMAHSPRECPPGSKAAAPSTRDLCDGRTLYEQLKPLSDRIIKMASDKTKENFFKYLDILVQWVNANPQTLNPELVYPKKTTAAYPEIDKTFQTYAYVNPYKPAELRLRALSCDLERLQSSILNELSGSNVPATISSISNIPIQMQMPFNRMGFMSPVPYLNPIPMMGGGVYDLESSLQNINRQYGADLFNAIFSDLQNTMRTMEKKMNISGPTLNKIHEKLQKFRSIEEELRTSIKNLVERNKLYQASYGRVNPFTEEPAQYQAILSKHSNLLDLNKMYNTKAIQLIDVFKGIADAVLGKMESSVPVKEYERPLTMGYHLGDSYNGRK